MFLHAPCNAIHFSVAACLHRRRVCILISDQNNLYLINIEILDLSHINHTWCANYAIFFVINND